MNERLLDAINSEAGKSAVVDTVARFTANEGIYVLAAVLALAGLWELRHNRTRGITLGLAVVVALAVAGIGVLVASSFVTEARPFVGDADTRLLISHAADNSFPSDHTTVAAAAAMVAALAWPRWGWLAVLGAALIGLSRVFVGVHFPSDVAAGLAIGGAAAVAGWVTASRVPVGRISRSA